MMASKATLNRQVDYFLIRLMLKKWQILYCFNSTKIVAAEPLNDKDYSQLRPIQFTNACTEAGDFGWDKIDRGSAFLIDYLPQFLSDYKNASQTLLDLGCGYGYIALSASNTALIE